MVLVKAQFKVLREEVSWYKAMFPHSDNAAVVDCKAQLSQGHVQLVHTTRTHAHTHLTVHHHRGNE